MPYSLLPSYSPLSAKGQSYERFSAELHKNKVENSSLLDKLCWPCYGKERQKYCDGRTDGQSVLYSRAAEKKLFEIAKDRTIKSPPLTKKSSWARLKTPVNRSNKFQHIESNQAAFGENPTSLERHHLPLKRVHGWRWITMILMAVYP